MPESITEFVTSRGSRLKIDNGGGVIRGVKVLGTESANGRTYPRATLQKALPLYAEARVNVNHPEKSAGQPRRYEDRIGMIRDPELRDDGIYGDLYYNPKHVLAPQLEWDAEHSPASVGLSHNVSAAVSKANGRMVVEDILKVLSVDLVADPATTRGLFEALEGENDMALKDVTVEQLREEAPEIVKAIITEALAEHDKTDELAKSNARIAALEAEYKAMQGKVQSLTEENVKLAAEKSAAERREAIEAALAESKLPKDVLTEDLRATIHAYEDVEAAKKFIGSLAEAIGKVSGKPKSKEQGVTEDKTENVSDGKSFTAAITR